MFPAVFLHLSSLSMCALRFLGFCTGSSVHKACSATSKAPVSMSPSGRLNHPVSVQVPCICAHMMSKWAVTDLGPYAFVSNGHVCTL
ncbi:hypothetical protein EDB19DRAFT_1718860 [Suillus lakei]|nr:hypothetical protein EDB19DRAFT_1756830 [Suillus lakei]KAG1737338.1 hypothetical protein EDB19DRAFT_1718860 [Suillus lakei]